RELAKSPGLDVEYPNTSRIANRAKPSRNGKVSAIWRPGRILILTVIGELPHHAILNSDRPHLEVAVLLLECDEISLGRPVCARSIAALSWNDRSNPPQPSAIDVHRVELRRERNRRHEHDLLSIRTEARRRSLETSTSHERHRHRVLAVCAGEH